MSDEINRSPSWSRKKRDRLLSMVADIQGKCAVLRHENNKLRAENDRLRLDLFGPYRDAFLKSMDCVDRIFSHRDGRPDPVVPDFAKLGENKFEACVRLAKEYAAERDTTPVDAEWLDGVMGPRKQDVMHRDFWEKSGFAVHDWHDRRGFRLIVGHSVDIQNPTRGDVLTALRLFGGDKPQ